MSETVKHLPLSNIRYVILPTSLIQNAFTLQSESVLLTAPVIRDPSVNVFKNSFACESLFFKSPYDALTNGNFCSFVFAVTNRDSTLLYIQLGVTDFPIGKPSFSAQCGRAHSQQRQSSTCSNWNRHLSSMV